MPPGEHIHIISAGENIHIAYPAIFRTLPTITRAYVLADSDFYGISTNPGIEKQRQLVRNAVTTMRRSPHRSPSRAPAILSLPLPIHQSVLS